MTVAPTDAELLARAGQDAAAFRQLFDRHAEAIEHYLRRRTASREDALDMTAETFAQAWLSRDRFEDRRNGSAAPWLLGIARNVLRRSWRQARVESSARLRLGMLRETAVQPEADHTVLEDPGLAAAMAALPAGQRAAVTMRVMEDMDYEHIAGELGCSETAARIKVTRGLAGVRQRWEVDSNG